MTIFYIYFIIVMSEEGDSSTDKRAKTTSLWLELAQETT